MNSVKFINAGGVLAVTGDFGNWIFCREFMPSKNGYASDGYWREKASISSQQVMLKFDSGKTEIEIKRRLNEEDTTEEEKEYYNDLLRHLEDGEVNYMYHAYYDSPSGMDSESIPCVKSPDYWFLCVLDAFDEICDRISA